MQVQVEIFFLLLYLCNYSLFRSDTSFLFPMNAVADLLSIEDAILVLSKTNNGKDLDSAHMETLRQVVRDGNVGLSECARVEWGKIVSSIRMGTYSKEWLYGVEHLRKDAQGYVYWKDVRVERFNYPSFDDEFSAAKHLGAIFEHLERLETPKEKLASELRRVRVQLRCATHMPTDKVMVVSGLGIDTERLAAHDSSRRINISRQEMPWKEIHKIVRIDTSVPGFCIDKERKRLTREISAECDHMTAIDFLVVVQEDIFQLETFLDRQKEWACGVSVGAYQVMHDVPARLMGEIREMNLNLPTRQEVVDALMDSSRVDAPPSLATKTEKLRTSWPIP